MNTRFIGRGLLVALPAAAILAIVGLNLSISRTQMGRPPDPTPPPPTILAPRGEMPAGPGGLEEWVRYRGQDYVLSGSAFLMALADGDVVGVTTAHSVSIGDPGRPIERIALSVAGQTGHAAEFDTLRGAPGQPFADDLSVDYVLLHVKESVDPALVLAADPRGGPQPGERVALFSGLGDGQGGRRVLNGTVQSAGQTGAWVLMDEETFNPALMSGSPFVSQHTGKVVGMAVAATRRHYRLFPQRYRVVLGMHPIGSIVQLAESAEEFPRINEYQR